MADLQPIPRTPGFQDLTGHRYGRLMVLGYAGQTPSGKKYWWCLCDCGKEKRVAGRHMRNGATISCGCAIAEAISTHGKSGSAEHRIWLGLVSRCRNTRNNSFANYGGRGIRVCNRWTGSDGFRNFLSDMGPRPSPQHTVERKDNNGNYEPGNCCWATRREQARNNRRTRLVTLDGRTMCIRDWCAERGLSHKAVYERINRYGWPIELALSTKTRRGQRRPT